MAAQKGKKVGLTKPNDPASAFDFFSQHYLEHEKKTFGEAVDSIGFTGRCRKVWNQLAADQQQHFENQAEKDKERHQSEMKEYRRLAAEEKKKAKKLKDPNAPKKPLSAYIWFCNEERPALKEMYPELKFVDVGIELGRLWREASEERKRRCHFLAERDKARYQRELAAYTNSQAVASTSGRR